MDYLDYIILWINTIQYTAGGYDGARLGKDDEIDDADMSHLPGSSPGGLMQV